MSKKNKKLPLGLKLIIALLFLHILVLLVVSPIFILYSLAFLPLFNRIFLLGPLLLSLIIWVILIIWLFKRSNKARIGAIILFSLELFSGIGSLIFEIIRIFKGYSKGNFIFSIIYFIIIILISAIIIWYLTRAKTKKIFK